MCCSSGMELNVNALNQNIEYQKTALTVYLQAGVITQSEHDRALDGLRLNQRLNTDALKSKDTVLEVTGTKIVTNYSL
jgi:hypothetical protein